MIDGENMDLMTLGRCSYIDRGATVVSWRKQNRVYVGRYCSIARDCAFFLDADHRPDWVSTSTMLKGPVTPEINEYLHNIGHNRGRGDIVIGNDVWIGARSIIMSGAHIGDGAVIAAGSVVSGKVKPYTVVGGNPATFLYTRFEPEIVEALREIRWWDWPEEKVKEMADLIWSTDVRAFIEIAKQVRYPKLTLVGVENSDASANDDVNDGTKVTFINTSSMRTTVKARFIEPYTGISRFTMDIDIAPDMMYWVWAPFQWEGRYLEITNDKTKEVLLHQILPSDTHNDMETYDYGRYLKRLLDAERDENNRIGIISLMDEHHYVHDYSDFIDVEPGDVVVDVGFNYGIFSLRALRNGASRVYGFEPNLSITGMVKDIYPDPDKVTIVEAAVSDYPGTTKFYDTPGSIISSTFLRPAETDLEYDVQKINLFDYIRDNDIRRIDLLKVDCEGEEYRIFESIPDWYFADNVKKIILEYYFNAQDGSDVRKLTDKLERTGFEWKFNPTSNFSTHVGMIYAKNVNLSNPGNDSKVQ